MTHVSIYRPPPGPVTVIIGTRQIYANRYFEASLGVTAILDSVDGSDGAVPFDLLYLNRARGPTGSRASGAD